jgi:hypothetical protein
VSTVAECRPVKARWVLSSPFHHEEDRRDFWIAATMTNHFMTTTSSQRRDALLPALRHAGLETPGSLFQHALQLLGLSEPRQNPRHPCRGRASCRSIALRGNALWPALICDLSRGGVRLSAAQPLAPGKLLAVQTPGIPAEISQPLLMTVLHTERTVPDQWFMGGAWAQPLSEPQLDALLGAANGAR